MNLSLWNSLRATRPQAPSSPLELSETPASAGIGTSRETKLLTFWIRPRDSEHLDALKRARRAMIREEVTRGLFEGEPPLSEATFSDSMILWEVPFGEQMRCREKLADLLRRANGLIPANVPPS